MKRALVIVLASVVAVGACVFAATALLGGGTVRAPGSGSGGGTTPGQETAAVTSKPGRSGRPGAAGSGVTLAAVGDTMLGNTPESPADPGSYLDHIKGQLSGDVVFGNLEGTLTDVSDSPKCGGAPSGDCYAFRTPPSYARYLAARASR